MSRILATIAALSLLLFAAALVMGLAIGDLYARPLPDADTFNWARVHRLSGVAAALAVVLVECVIVTYFIGTSRWCREVVETYGFDPQIVRNSNRLKRRTFPWALTGMLALVAIVALGAAADPGAIGAKAANWTSWHLAAAFCGIALVSWTYVVAWKNVSTQHAIIQDLLAKVAQVREKQRSGPEGTP